MSRKRYPEEFEFEAIKQITERGYKVGDAAERLGVISKSLATGKRSMEIQATSIKLLATNKMSSVESR